MEMLEWRAQRLEREDKSNKKGTLYEVQDADRVNVVNDLSAFGIGTKSAGEEG